MEDGVVVRRNLQGSGESNGYLATADEQRYWFLSPESLGRRFQKLLVFLASLKRG